LKAQNKKINKMGEAWGEWGMEGASGNFRLSLTKNKIPEELSPLARTSTTEAVRLS